MQRIYCLFGGEMGSTLVQLANLFFATMYSQFQFQFTCCNATLRNLNGFISRQFSILFQ